MMNPCCRMEASRRVDGDGSMLGKDSRSFWLRKVLLGWIKYIHTWYSLLELLLFDIVLHTYSNNTLYLPITLHIHHRRLAQ